MGTSMGATLVHLPVAEGVKDHWGPGPLLVFFLDLYIISNKLSR